MTKAQQLANDLREAAAFIETLPDEAIAETVEYQPDKKLPVIRVFCTSKEELVKWARWLGTWKKRIKDNDFHVDRDFGMTRLTAYCYRSHVCELKRVKKEVEVDEWSCPDSLLDALEK